MAQSLEMFVEEQMNVLKEFEKHWLLMNVTNPEHYPMVLPDGQEGLWCEMLANFQEKE